MSAKINSGSSESQLIRGRSLLFFSCRWYGKPEAYRDVPRQSRKKYSGGYSSLYLDSLLNSIDDEAGADQQCQPGNETDCVEEPFATRVVDPHPFGISGIVKHRHPRAFVISRAATGIDVICLLSQPKLQAIVVGVDPAPGKVRSESQHIANTRFCLSGLRAKPNRFDIGKGAHQKQRASHRQGDKNKESLLSLSVELHAQRLYSGE